MRFIPEDGGEGERRLLRQQRLGLRRREGLVADLDKK